MKDLESRLVTLDVTPFKGSGPARLILWMIPTPFDPADAEIVLITTVESMEALSRALPGMIARAKAELEKPYTTWGRPELNHE